MKKAEIIKNGNVNLKNIEVPSPSTEVKGEKTVDWLRTEIELLIDKIRSETYTASGGGFGEWEWDYSEEELIKEVRVFTSLISAEKDKEIERLTFDLGQTEIELKHKSTLLTSCETALADRDKQIEELKAENKILVDCIQNLMAVVDTPVGRMNNKGDFSKEAANIGREIMRKYERI